MANTTGSVLKSQPYIKGTIVLPELSGGHIDVSGFIIPSEGGYDGVMKPLHSDEASVTPPTPGVGGFNYFIIQVYIGLADDVITPEGGGGSRAGLISVRYDANNYPEVDMECVEVYRDVYDENMPSR